MRVGIGYDVHRLVPGRPLVLGGVSIDFELGLLGHSDGDVLSHAIMDALLGAAGLGDIGHHFPDTDPQSRGISSLLLMGRVGQLLAGKGWQVVNIDASLVAQRPRLSPFIEEMKQRLGEVLHLAADSVNIKATTGEGLGFAGREEGMAAWAVALLSRPGEKG